MDWLPSDWPAVCRLAGRLLTGRLSAWPASLPASQLAAGRLASWPSSQPAGQTAASQPGPPSSATTYKSAGFVSSGPLYRLQKKTVYG